MRRTRKRTATVARRKLSIILVSVWLAGGILQTACTEPFEPASNLGDTFLVLAIRAEPRALSPRQSVELTSLDYVPPNTHVDPEQLWVVCLPEPGEGPEACLGAALGQIGTLLSLCQQNCSSDPDRAACEQSCNAQTLTNLLCSPDEDTRACIAGYGPSARYELPPWFSRKMFFTYLLAAAGKDGLQGCFDQWTQMQQTSFPAPTSECTVSFKRIPVASGDDRPEANPSVISVMVGGQTSTGQGLQIHPEDIDDNGGHISLHAKAEADEDSYMTWFSNCGSLDHSRTFGKQGDNRLKLKERSVCSLFIVVRDNQYGVGWLHVELDPTKIPPP